MAKRCRRGRSDEDSRGRARDPFALHRGGQGRQTSRPDSGVSGRGCARRLLTGIPLALAATILLYLAAAIAGSLIPRNASWEEPSGGVLIFVRNNGIHVDLVLPASAAGIDLHRLAPPGHVGNPADTRGWVAFGWGQREFYLEMQRWSDLMVRNVVRAVFGGPALMRVEHLGLPQASDRSRPLRLDDDAYRRLVAAIAAGFQRGHDGNPVVLPGSGYGRSDIFYEAAGRYDVFNTSNQWAADALASAGVEVGIWTPLAQGLMRWFPQPAQDTGFETPVSGQTR